MLTEERCVEKKKGWLYLGEDRTQRRHRRGGDGDMVDPWGRNWFRIRITRPSQNRSRIYIRSRLRRIDPPRDHSYGKCGSSILPTLNSLFFVFFLSSRQSAPLWFSFYSYVFNCVIVLCISSNASVSSLCFIFLIQTLCFNISSKIYLRFEPSKFIFNFIFLKCFFFFLVILCFYIIHIHLQ